MRTFVRRFRRTLPWAGPVITLAAFDLAAQARAMNLELSRFASVGQRLSYELAVEDAQEEKASESRLEYRIGAVVEYTGGTDQGYLFTIRFHPLESGYLRVTGEAPIPMSDLQQLVVEAHLNWAGVLMGTTVNSANRRLARSLLLDARMLFYDLPQIESNEGVKWTHCLPLLGVTDQGGSYFVDDADAMPVLLERIVAKREELAMRNGILTVRISEKSVGGNSISPMDGEFQAVVDLASDGGFVVEHRGTLELWDEDRRITRNFSCRVLGRPEVAASSLVQHWPESKKKGESTELNDRDGENADDGVAPKGRLRPYEKAPELLAMDPPEYPDKALARGIEGQVFVRLLVGADGRPKRLMVQQGVLELDSSAIASAATARFKPASLDGKPVRVWMILPIEYDLH